MLYTSSKVAVWTLHYAKYSLYVAGILGGKERFVSHLSKFALFIGKASSNTHSKAVT